MSAVSSYPEKKDASGRINKRKRGEDDKESLSPLLNSMGKNKTTRKEPPFHIWQKEIHAVLEGREKKETGLTKTPSPEGKKERGVEVHHPIKEGGKDKEGRHLLGSKGNEGGNIISTMKEG